MATTVRKFIGKCDEIVAAKPVYKKGRSSLTECDCIGMIKYGLRENGVKFSTTGSNYTFRKQVKNARKISSASVLKKGDVVFKYFKPGDKEWDLPEKYQEGGSDYNGDLNDYYHIGAVKSVKPLEIIHMTSPTAKTDTKVGNWKMTAELDSQYISDYGAADEPSGSDSGADSGSSGTVTDEPAQDFQPVTATVWSENGKPVKLRQKPSTKCRLYDEIPVGTEVTIVQDEGTWCKIDYKHRNGWYMMTKFLMFG